MNRDKFKKIAMLMNNPEKEEAHTALKIANKLLKENNMTWADVLSGGSSSSGSRYKRETRQAKPNDANCLLDNAEIITETDKAFLVEVTLKNNEEVEVWFPKSQTDQKRGGVYITSWIRMMKNRELKELGYDSELSIL